MSIPTLAARPAGGGAPLDTYARAAGLADARAEQAAGTPLSVLETRLEEMTEHLHEVSDTYHSYVLGYAQHVATLMRRRQTAQAVAAVHIQTQIRAAHEEQENHR